MAWWRCGKSKCPCGLKVQSKPAVLDYIGPLFDGKILQTKSKGINKRKEWSNGRYSCLDCG